MTAKEKIEFITKKIKELNRITSEITDVFPEKSFSLDGILIGNIVEVLTAQIYGIDLYKQSEKTHDGEVNGRKVQIKGTQGTGIIVVKEEPEYLLVEFLDKEAGTIEEIYNGPGKLVWEHANYVPSMGQYTLRVNKLLELDKNVPDKERILPIIEINKYSKQVTCEDKIVKQKSTKRQNGKTLVVGLVNRNNQMNKGCLNKPGTHYNQKAYLMHCNICGYEYEANGCDVAIRKCPKCQ